MTPEALVNVLEAAMLAAGRALTLEDFLALFTGSRDSPDRGELRDALARLEESLSARGIELVEVASGYRLQVREEYSPWLAGLFSERPPRYSRALLETLALIAYRQPITRGEIEDVRGVVVSSNIVKTLMEREWIRVLGHREVPGRPALYGTTREFLDHFGLKGLDGLPPLADIRDLDQMEPDLFSPASAGSEVPGDAGGQIANGSTDAPGDGEASPPDSNPLQDPLPDPGLELGGAAVAPGPEPAAGQHRTDGVEDEARGSIEHDVADLADQQAADGQDDAQGKRVEQAAQSAAPEDKTGRGENVGGQDDAEAQRLEPGAPLASVAKTDAEPEEAVAEHDDAAHGETHGHA